MSQLVRPSAGFVSFDRDGPETSPSGGGSAWMMAQAGCLSLVGSLAARHGLPTSDRDARWSRGAEKTAIVSARAGPLAQGCQLSVHRVLEPTGRLGTPQLTCLHRDLSCIRGIADLHPLKTRPLKITSDRRLSLGPGACRPSSDCVSTVRLSGSAPHQVRFTPDAECRTLFLAASAANQR